MDTVIKLVLPFFSTSRDYADVLKKLAGFAFYETYLITFLLRANPRLDSFFASVESWGPVGKAVGTIPHYDVINLSGFVIAFVLAVLTHTFQFHDRISDLLGIRRRFDCKCILIPLAERVGSPLTKDKEIKIAKQRHDLMHALFYKYASSRAENPLVDKHDIEHALTAWSWFWVFVEGVAYFGAGAVVAYLVGSRNLAVGFAAVSIALVVLALVQRARLNRYARPQIDTIASDPTAAYEIKSRFDAL
jgi:hypothetical protein